MSTFTVREAAARLDELIDAAAEEPVLIVKGNRAVRLIPAAVPHPVRRRFGSAVGQIRMAADFEAPLEDLADYM